MIFTAFMASLFITSIVGGLIFMKSTDKKWVKYSVIAVNFMFLAVLLFSSFNVLLPQTVHAADTASGSSPLGLGYIAAALAVGVASVGAGIAVGIAGSAAIGAISEKPEILGRALIIIGLGEGIAIYGLIISIIILSRL